MYNHFTLNRLFAKGLKTYYNDFVVWIVIFDCLWLITKHSLVFFQTSMLSKLSTSIFTYYYPKLYQLFNFLSGGQLVLSSNRMVWVALCTKRLSSARLLKLTSLTPQLGKCPGLQTGLRCEDDRWPQLISWAPNWASGKCWAARGLSLIMWENAQLVWKKGLLGMSC